MVPEGWNQVRLGNVASFRNGLNFTKDSEGKIVRVVGIPHFRHRTVMTDFDQIEPVAVGSIADDDFLKSGDVLFVRSNGNKALIGRCLFFPEVNEPVSFSGFTIRGRLDKKDILPEYFRYLTETKIVKDQFSKGGGGTNISNLTQEVLSRIEINLPPLPEQKKIAEILSTWDKAIETTEKLHANAEAQKRALMQQLLTGKRPLPGFEGREWQKLHLSGLAEVLMGSSPPSSAYNQRAEGIPLLQGNADLRNGRSKPRFHTTVQTQLCRPGDTLLSVRAPVGSVARSEHHACVGRGLAAVRAKTISDQEWIYQLLVWLEPRWARFSQGSTFEAVNGQEIRGLKIYAPSDPSEREGIAKILTAQDEICAKLQIQLQTVRTEKRALMQQLLTGKRRVKV